MNTTAETEAAMSSKRTSNLHGNVQITAKPERGVIAPERGFVNPARPSPAALQARDVALARTEAAREFLAASVRTARA